MNCEQLDSKHVIGMEICENRICVGCLTNPLWGFGSNMGRPVECYRMLQTVAYWMLSRISSESMLPRRMQIRQHRFPLETCANFPLMRIK